MFLWGGGVFEFFSSSEKFLSFWEDFREILCSRQSSKTTTES
jgi:hypothetical protein